MNFSQWAVDHLPFVSAMANPALANPEQRPILTRWLETGLIGAFAAFVALQISAAVQSEKLASQSARLARIETKVDQMSMNVTIMEINSERISTLRADVQELKQRLTEFNERK